MNVTTSQSVKTQTRPDLDQYKPEAHSFVLVKLQEWYDFESNLARLDYQPLIKEDIEVLGQDPVTEIHDFNMGNLKCSRL